MLSSRLVSSQLSSAQLSLPENALEPRKQSASRAIALRMMGNPLAVGLIVSLTHQDGSILQQQQQQQQLLQIAVAVECA